MRNQIFHRDFSAMEILTALGVNSTIGIQFIIFVVAYLFLSNLVFKPYHKAFEERVSRTQGDTDLAERIISETKDLELEFETKARSLNNETKIIFDRSRSEAMREYDRMVSQAKQRAKEQLDKSRLQVAHEMEKSREEVTKQIPEITKSLVTKMIG